VIVSLRQALLFYLVTLGSASGHIDSFLEMTPGNASALLTCGDPTLGPVLAGVDLVATFRLAEAGTLAAPTMGLPQYSWTTVNGYSFYFSSQETLDAYRASPDSFPLGAGGYCGYACSGHDSTCDCHDVESCEENDFCKGPSCLTSPLNYEIMSDGKLYFFFAEGGKDTFKQYDALNISIEHRSSTHCDAAIEKAKSLAEDGACYNTEFYYCYAEVALGITPSNHSLSARRASKRPRANARSSLVPETTITDA